MVIAGRISLLVRYVNNIYCGASAGETVAKTVGSLWCMIRCILVHEVHACTRMRGVVST